MNCLDTLPLMHEYMDGDLQGADALALKEHLLACPACRERLRRMERTEAAVRTLPRPQAAPDLKDRIMASLPRKRMRSRWINWVRRHPAVSVASVFLLVMMASFASLWNQDKEMVVKGADLDQVVIQGDTVYVPAGHTIEGNLLVQRGKIQVDGEVKGNLIVIDGSYQLASTAHISGQIKQVDQALDWIWYKTTELFNLVVQ